VLLIRRSPRAALPAAAGAALLLTDAWFDVCTSAPGLDRLLAAGEAALIELPLAAAAIWLAVVLTRDTGRERPKRARYGNRGRTRRLHALPPPVELDRLGHGEQDGRILQRREAVRRGGHHQQVAPPGLPGVLAGRQPDPAG
jgi:hypothetical protein